MIFLKFKIFFFDCFWSTYILMSSILTKISFLLALSLVFRIAHADCVDSKIIYKLKGKITELPRVVCKNKFDQYHSEGCENGCKFKELILEKSIKETSSNSANPGAGVCKKMGFTSFVSDIKNDKFNVKNVELCFDKDKQNFASKAFLADLVYEINNPKN